MLNVQVQKESIKYPEQILESQRLVYQHFDQ